MHVRASVSEALGFPQFLLPFSEPPVPEKDDHNEDETQVEEPDPVTEESRDVVRQPLRLRQSRLTSKQPPPSAEQEEGKESKSKRARVNVSELLHDAFLAKAARSEEKQWHGLNGRDKLLFLDAVSKQWSARQENAAATLIPPAEAKVIWRTLRKQGLQGRVMQSRFVLVDKTKVKAQLRILWTRNPPLVSWFLKTQIQMCWTFGETRPLS